MKPLYILLILSAGILLGGCTETNEIINATQKPVIEAYLAPGQPVSLRLSTVIGYSESGADSMSRPIDGQKIQIKASDGKVFNLTGTGDGYYTSAKNEIVKANLGYELNFTYNKLAISAKTSIPTKPVGFKISTNTVSLTQLDFSQGRGGPGGGPMGGPNEDNTPLVLTWNNPTGDYYFVTQLYDETLLDPVIITPNGNNPNDRGRGGRRINNQPTNNAVANLQPRSFQNFGKYYVILYHVATDYADLYRSGGTTTQNITTPPTSITNGLGIFTGVNADTVKVQVLRK